MARFIKNRIKTLGKAPGSLIHIGTKKMEKSRVRLIKYNTEEIIEEEIDVNSDFGALINKKHTSWINIDGLHDLELMQRVQQAFNIPPLVMEDILNTDNRPKVIESENHLCIILKVFHSDNENNPLKAEQISFILGEGYILTIQERVGDFFNPLRERIRSSSGKIRSRGAAYLQYALTDTIADTYLYIIEKLGNIIEDQEKEVIKSDSKQLAETLYLQKTEMNYLRKSIRPVKEIILRILKSDFRLIDKETLHFWHDLEDLVLQATETVDVYYIMISDQINLYQTNISNKVNDVMKVLTIFASIFIPLTFIAGIYGTNFDNIPELHFKYGYFAMLGLMAIVSIVMLVYFRLRKWF